MKELNTPLKRVGFLIFSAGILILIIGIYQISEDAYNLSRFFKKWIGSVFFERYSFSNYPAASYGTWITIIGLFLSFLYDKVTYRLIGWIKSGSKAELSDSPQSVPLHFKDGATALEYICKYMDTALIENELIPCLVVATSQSKESGAFAVISLPTDDGPKKSIAAFLSDAVPTDIAGKLCAVIVGPVNEHAGVPTFLLCAELEPSWSNGAWKVRRRF